VDYFSRIHFSASSHFFRIKAETRKKKFERMKSSLQHVISLVLTVVSFSNALVPLIDGGKTMPKLYDGWFNDQIAKQANTALSRAIAAGKVCNKSFQ